MQSLLIAVVGLAAGVLVGLMGIGGGIIIVPALVYLFGMDQHTAQGTSLFVLLPPLGLGALSVYWKRGYVDLHAGVLCAVGILVGGYFGGLAAVAIPSRPLQALFGLFLMFSAVMLWKQASRTRQTLQDIPEATSDHDEAYGRLISIFVIALLAGGASGLLGIGGGILVVLLLVMVLGYDQHRAQGTSLVALVPPTGLLGFLAYYRAREVDLRAGMLMIPGIFLGGMLGGKLAAMLPPRKMRLVFAAFLFVLGIWQVVSAWSK